MVFEMIIRKMYNNEKDIITEIKELNRLIKIKNVEILTILEKMNNEDDNTNYHYYINIILIILIILILMVK